MCNPHIHNIIDDIFHKKKYLYDFYDIYDDFKKFKKSELNSTKCLHAKMCPEK